MFDVAVTCLVLTALLSYLNHRFIGLPTTIGVMGIALLFSFVLFGLDKIGFGTLRDYEVSLLSSVDFSELLMQGMLSLLLFAGALHVDLSELKSYKWQVGILAVFGTLGSTALIGFGLWAILPYTGVTLPLSYCLIFGALISPTDPIAVMGILKSAGAPKSLEIVIAGESLFNDGIGVVLFSLMLAMVVSGEAPTVAHGAMLLLKEGGGGIVFGLVLGYATYRMLKSIDSYQEEVLITLAAVLGGYVLASRLHVSGPLAMVVAGLIIGNPGRALAMSNKTREYLDMFWELLDSILNAVLFVLIGLEVILIEFSTSLVLVGAVVIVITLAARLLSVGAPTDSVAARVQFAAGRVAGTHLGWIAWRHFGRTGTLAAQRPGARPGADPDLWGGGVRDPGSGPQHRHDGARSGELMLAALPAYGLTDTCFYQRTALLSAKG